MGQSSWAEYSEKDRDLRSRARKGSVTRSLTELRRWMPQGVRMRSIRFRAVFGEGSPEVCPDDYVASQRERESKNRGGWRAQKASEPRRRRGVEYPHRPVA